MFSKKVYVLLVNFNGYKVTIECIDSVLKNDYENYKIVIVDNNSTDDSVFQISKWVNDNSPKYSIYPIKYDHDELENIQIINKKEKVLPLKTRQIVIIKSAYNNGFAAGNNIGIKYGLIKRDADYFWLLNNDTEITNNSLSELVKFAEKNNNIGIVSSRILFYDDQNTIQTLGNDHVSWKGIGHGSFDGISNSTLIPEFIEMKSVIGASLLIKIGVVKEIGLMDETYFMQHEESDWCIRASKANYKIYVNTNSIIIHKEGKSTGRKRKIKSFMGIKVSVTNISDFLMWGYYSFRNEIFFVRKHYKSKYLWYILIILPVKYIMKLLLILLFNDSYKIKRILLLNKAVFDGLFNKMGKTIDPLIWKCKFKYST